MNDADLEKLEVAKEHAKRRAIRPRAQDVAEGSCDLCPAVGELVEGLCSACRAKLHIKGAK